MIITYILSILLVFSIAAFGGSITSSNMDWYNNLILPAWIPSGQLIGTVWTILFLLIAISFSIFWNKTSGKTDKIRILIIALFAINLALNSLWSYLFFGLHNLKMALIEMNLLNLTIIGLIALLHKHSRLASGLLIPYFLWVSFATYLAYTIFSLN